MSMLLLLLPVLLLFENQPKSSHGSSTCGVCRWITRAYDRMHRVSHVRRGGIHTATSYPLSLAYWSSDRWSGQNNAHNTRKAKRFNVERSHELSKKALAL